METRLRNRHIAGTEAGSSIYRGYWYQVETRARIILFDVATIEANDLLQRRPSQLGFRAGDHAYRPLRSLHRGLVHRPEQFHQARNHKQSSDAGDQQPISLSARAMQLSIFGTNVSQAILYFTDQGFCFTVFNTSRSRFHGTGAEVFQMLP